MLGAHYSQCSEAVGAARMLNLKDVDVNEFEEVHTAANWARHAPPPGAVRMPLGPRFGVMAAELESFRYFLFAAAAEVPQAAAEEEETPKGPVEPHLASSVLETAGGLVADQAPVGEEVDSEQEAVVEGDLSGDAPSWPAANERGVLYPTTLDGDCEYDVDAKQEAVDEGDRREGAPSLSAANERGFYDLAALFGHDEHDVESEQEAVVEGDLGGDAPSVPAANERGVHYLAAQHGDDEYDGVLCGCLVCLRGGCHRPCRRGQPGFVEACLVADGRGGGAGDLGDEPAGGGTLPGPAAANPRFFTFAAHKEAVQRNCLMLQKVRGEHHLPGGVSVNSVKSDKTNGEQSSSAVSGGLLRGGLGLAECPNLQGMLQYKPSWLS